MMEEIIPANHLLDGTEISHDYLLRVVETFLRVDRFMSTISDLNHLLRLIMEEIENLVDAEASALLLYDDQEEELYFEVTLGEKKEEIKQVRLSLDEGIAGHAAKSGKSINVRDCHNDPRFLRRADEKTKFHTRCLAAVPMLRKGKLIGVLEALNKKENKSFTDEDVKLLEVLAGQAAIAIENALLYESSLKQERLAAMGEAVAGLAHYVKNIVTGLQGSTSLIQTSLESNNLEVVVKSFEIQKRSINKVSALVQDMLTYSKDRPPELENYHINTVINDVLEMVKDKADKKDIRLISDLAENIPTTRLDHTCMERAVLNLVGNGLDAVEYRQLMNEEHDGCVTVVSRLSDDGCGLLVEVSDNGCGIAEANIKKIFDVFFSTKGSRGTGLGLALSAKFVEEHGGRINAESTEGEGSKFILYLPLVLPVSMESTS